MLSLTSISNQICIESGNQENVLRNRVIIDCEKWFSSKSHERGIPYTSHSDNI